MGCVTSTERVLHCYLEEGPEIKLMTQESICCACSPFPAGLQVPMWLNTRFPASSSGADCAISVQSLLPFLGGI